MPKSTDTQLLQRDKHPDGRPVTQAEREQLLKPYLPAPRDTRQQLPSTPSSKLSTPAYPSSTRSRPNTRWQRPHLRPFLARTLHILLFHFIHFFFSLYIHARQLYHAIYSQIFAILYYHHRSPELIQKDVRGLSRLPKHLSIIVDLKGDEDGGAEGNLESLEKLAKDVSEISAWCACAGIQMLSVYERTGILKQHIPHLHSTLTSTLHAYYPTPTSPTFSIRAPHLPAYSRPSTPPSTSLTTTNGDSAPSPKNHLSILLLSATDGRSTLLDLTKTLTEMSQRGKLATSDISPELIDAEVTESSCGDPDLLIVMAQGRSVSSSSPQIPSRALGRLRLGRNTARRRTSSNTENKRGRRRRSKEDDTTASASENDDTGSERRRGNATAGSAICLDGYPPWQVRLTEICYSQDGGGVEYQAWLRALCRYAKAEMRFGR